MMHWAKYPSFVNGLNQYTANKLGENLDTFKQIVQDQKWDPKQLLLNKNLQDIFAD